VPPQLLHSSTGIIIFRVRSFFHQSLNLEEGQQIVVGFQKSSGKRRGKSDTDSSSDEENEGGLKTTFTLTILEAVWGTHHFVNILVQGASARVSETQPTKQTTGYIVCEDPFRNLQY